MVETYAKRTVQDSGQTPGYLQVNYSPDAFGASIGRAFQQAGQDLGQARDQIAQLDKTKKINDVQTTINKAKDQVRSSFFDPDYGIYAQQGGNAMGSVATARAAMENAKSQYIKELKDPDQQQLFEKLWSNETDNNLDKASLHEMKELGTYKVQTAKATLAGAITDAYNNYNDPKAIAKAIADADGIINANAMGLDPISLQSAKSEAKSQITLAAISRWATENPDRALDFYTQNKENLSGKDHIIAGQLVNSARDARTAEKNIARITASGGAAAGSLWQKVIQTESSGDPNAISSKGAIGLAQVMPDTARYMLRKSGQAELAQLDDNGIKKLLQTNPALGESLGKGYLNEQLQNYGGDVEAALVAYNAGPERADAFLKHNAGKPPGQRDYNVPGNEFLAKETQSYVNKILGTTGSRASTPEGYRLSDNNWNLKNFGPDDLMAPTPGGRWVDARAAQGLDNLADVMKQRFGVKISVNALEDTGSTAGKRRGTADPADNPHVENSQHLKGRAFDVQWQGMSIEQKQALIVEARQLGFSGFGFYGDSGHLHIDMGSERSWGNVPSWAQEAMKTPVKVQTDGAVAQNAPNSNLDSLPASGSGLFGMGAAGPSGAFVSTKAPDLNAWLAQADSISDPGERARTKEGLRVYAAQIEADNKSQVAQLKQGAWEKVLKGSVKDLTADVLAQLGPEFVGQLNTFETNRAKREMPMDWKAWADIPTDPQELIKIDPYTEYRNKLDNEHFDRLLTMWREANNKVEGRTADESLFEGARTTQTVIKDTMGAIGWTEKNNAAEMAAFSSKMDQRIIATQQELGRKLNAAEVQDIADKLLIQDKTSTWYKIGEGQGRAVDATKPDEFIAAQTWDQVQEDDQRAVSDTYQRYFNQAPDKEKATDIYNRAMRVYLGGTPDGPDEEKNDFRNRLEMRLNRVLSQKEFDKYYGKYLLTFINGRTR